MTTNFPTALDDFTNPTAADMLSAIAVLHSAQHANNNDAIEALEAKVGVDDSAVVTSLDYRVKQLETSPAGAGGSDTQIQYNNAGSLDGARLSYSYNGGQVTLATGQVEGVDHGEDFVLQGGDALNDANAGAFYISGGEAPGTGDGGKVDIHGGDSEAGVGGELLFQGGSSSTGNGGNISFKPGEGGLTPGKILFSPPGVGNVLELGLSQLVGADRVMNVPDQDGTIALLDGNGDLAFPADTSGVILKDRNDGTNYRLYVDSGVLLIEAV